ncbi:GDP-mannose 4,6-dehydratase [Sphingomonas sp. R86521]|uniref:GDP-mannose 4,6-dehydratase n=1 Tax=Sphingomonas sp. R86521 TaxID=3093860 RepID=UPI0036D27E91
MPGVDVVMETIPFRRILVTGANGFVGRYLVPVIGARLAEGACMTLATRTPRSGGGHATVLVDLADPVSVAAAVASVRPDLVIHLAAQASVGQSLGTAADTWAVNLCGSLALARAVADIVPDCTVLQISSAEVYGLTFNHGTVRETDPLRPQSAYGRSKAAAEAMLADVLPASARLIIARPSNHSGPGQDERFVIPTFAAQIARIERGALAEIHVGNLDAERDVLDVRDVVAAYLALLLAAPALPQRNLFNIASGKTVKIGDILDRLRAMVAIGTTVTLDPARMRPSDVPRAALDTSAIRAATGWSPMHDLDAVLASVLAEWRSKTD